MTVFKGKKYCSEFSDGSPNGSFVTVADSGLISLDAIVTWLRKFQAHRVAGASFFLLDVLTSYKKLEGSSRVL
jgi:hypothetical protein